MPQSRSVVKEETLAFSMNWCSCGLESTTTHYRYHHYSLLHHHHYDLYYLLSTAITQGATTTTNTTTTANATSHRTTPITSIIITISSICISITTGYFCYYHFLPLSLYQGLASAGAAALHLLLRARVYTLASEPDQIIKQPTIITATTTTTTAAAQTTTATITFPS